VKVSVDYIVKNTRPSIISVVAVAEDDLLHSALEKNDSRYC